MLDGRMWFATSTLGTLNGYLNVGHYLLLCRGGGI